VLFPIFDDVKYACEYVENDWLQTTCFSAFHLLIEIFSQYYDSLAELVFSDLLELISHAMKQDDDRVASIGVACYVSFVNSIEQHPSAERWQDIINVLVQAIATSSLDQLRPTEAELVGPTAETATVLKRRCAVLIQYMDSVGPLARSDACRKVNPAIGGMADLAQELGSVHETLVSCNCNAPWREQLDKAGWAAEVGDLTRHEVLAFSTLVRLLCCMCSSDKLEDSTAFVEQITKLLLTALAKFASAETAEAWLTQMQSAIVIVLPELAAVPQLSASADLKAALSSLSESSVACDELKAACTEALKSFA